MSLFLSTFIFLSQRRDYVIFRHPAKKLIYLISCFQIAFARSEIFQKNARELGVGRRQFHAGVNGFILFIFYNITLGFLNVLHWMIFDLFFIAWQWKRLIWSLQSVLFNQISTRCQTLPTHSKIITARCVPNRLKNVVTQFQSIFDLCRVFPNKVTYRVTHPTETALRRLVVFTFCNYFTSFFLALCDAELCCKFTPYSECIYGHANKAVVVVNSGIILGSGLVWKAL